MGVNKVILIGNLGRDPELRYTQSQTPVVTLNLATGERRKDASGNWTDHTEWHSVVAFGRTAENCANFLKKGRQIFVEGRIQTRKWQDKEGRDRYTTEVVANNVQFLGGKDANGYPSHSDSEAPPMAAAGGGGSAAVFDSSSQAAEVAFDDDDIPF